MTNGDYIRQKMSDDYIAQEFCGIACVFYGDCKDCPLWHSPTCGHYEERLKWLKAKYVGEEEVETGTNAASYLLSEIHNVLHIIKWYEGCDYDKYCISEGEGNIRDCIERLQHVENGLKKMEEE